MKRFLTFLAFVAIAFSSYAYDCKIDGIYYNLSDGEAIVTYRLQQASSYSGAVVIPEKITYNSTTYSVTSIGTSAFNYCSNLTSVTIPNSVTSICDYAFSGCSRLTSVDIPNSVSSIGGSAFRSCSSLISVTIPNSVTSIGDYAFNACSSLTSITIPNSVTSIGEGAFYYCSRLTSATIPNSVTNIGDMAFSYCSGLTSIKVEDGNMNYSSWDNVIFNKDKTELVFCIRNKKGSYTIPNSVTSIGDWAFLGCSSLTSITIPNSVTSIGSSAFYGCSGLTSFTIPNSVTKIGANAFDGCSSLPVIDNIRYADTYLVEVIDKGCTSVKIKEGTRFIGSNALSSCFKLTTMTIPTSVTSIGNYAFGGCLGLTSVTVPNSVTSIDNNAFLRCFGLTTIMVKDGNTNYCSLNNVLFNRDKTEIICCAGGKKGTYTIPSSVKSIGDYAFSDCYSLTSIVIPNSVKKIGANAFSSCSGLTSVAIPNSVTNIGDYAFYSCFNLTSVTIPNSVTSIGDYAFNACSNLNSIEIPSSVTSIGNFAFNACSNLISIEVPNSVTKIGANTFSSCSSLTSVTIPNSVTKIGANAFSSCSSLTSVTIPNSVSKIDASTFKGCSSLTSVTIPNSVTNIGESAFSSCSNLNSITIPNSVTSIGYDAFSGCSNLQDAYCFPEAVPTTDPYAFSTSYIKSATLHIPAASLEAYSSSEPWGKFGTILPIVLSSNLTDGEAYTNDEEKAYDELTFTKTFSSSVVNKWNALYVPISINIEDYLDDFDFAEIYNISPTEDTNGDGEIDGRDANKLIVNKLKTGTTIPNKPYLIRPKNAGTYTFASADNVLYPAEEKSYSCSTMTDEYTFTGLYTSQGVTGSDKYYMTIKGILDFSPTKTITVKPNRWIMTVKSRNGSSSSANAKAISLSVIGEDEGTTAIEHIDAVRNADVIYNLNGVKMDSKNLPAGIYIKNGKKVFVK